MSDEDTDSGTDVLEVSEFYEMLTSHLEAGFGRRHPHWVRGEIEKVYEKTHLYLDVVDAAATTESPRPVLKVRCWASVWAPLKKDLASRGVILQEGTVLSFKGYLGLYKPRGEVALAVTAIDVEGLEGDVARARAALIEKLHREGVLEANKQLIMPEVCVRIGLVSSPRTEGFNDFTGQLLQSGWGFDVQLVAATVQGDSAPDEILRAMDTLEDAGVDVICLVRGGGSRGDLAAFDDERLARRIGAARCPVLTGIGHTGDVSVADRAAYHAAITPTKLGEFLVSRIGEWHHEHVSESARLVRRVSVALVEEATEYVAERRRTVTLAVRDRLGSEQLRLDHARASLARQARFVLDAESRRVASTRALLTAYDPQRRLAQGWSIVTGSSGELVRSVRDVAVGDTLSVRVSDGTLSTSIHEKKEARDG